MSVHYSKPDSKQHEPRPTTLGLVGYGRWGKIYKEEIESLQNDGLSLGVICTSQEQTHFQDINLIRDWRDLEQFPNLSGVIIATPPETHLEIASHVLELGKSVLIEKPVCLSLGQMAGFAERFKKIDLNTKVLINHIHLFNQRFLALLKAIPLIQPILSIEASGGGWGPFRSGYSSLWDYGPHDLSMVLKILDKMPLEGSLTLLSKRATEEGMGHNYRLDLTFPGDIPVTINVGSLYPQKKRLLRIAGKGGILVFDDTLKNHALMLDHKPLSTLNERSPLQQVLLEFRSLIQGTGHPTQVKNFGIHMAMQITRILAAAESSSGNPFKIPDA